MAKAPSKGKEAVAKAPPKKAAKPAAPKAAKAAAKPAAAKATKPAKTGEKVRAGDQYSCEVCGLVVSVDEACGCVDACDIVCCGQQMKATP
jgi:hypothetical protein